MRNGAEKLAISSIQKDDVPIINEKQCFIFSVGSAPPPVSADVPPIKRCRCSHLCLRHRILLLLYRFPAAHSPKIGWTPPENEVMQDGGPLRAVKRISAPY